MLHSNLRRAEVLVAPARAGHCRKVHVADGNAPLSTLRGPHARHVALNPMAGGVFPK